MLVEVQRRGVSAGQVVAAALVAMAAVAAGVIVTTQDGDRPSAPAAIASAQAQFDQLPRYPRSEPVGAVVSSGAALSRSFRVAAVAPTAVIEFYADSLVGWRPLRSSGSPGGPTGRWASGSYEVMVAVRPADASGGTASTEYLVTLREV